MDNSAPPPHEGSLKALKLIFFAMMLILIGGAVFLFVSIYERNQVKTTSGQCVEGEIILPVEGEVQNMVVQGDIITVLTTSQKNIQHVLVMNTCSGKVMRRIVLQQHHNATH